MKIQVTKDDIYFGIRHLSTRCAVALATSRATGLRAHVSPTNVFVGDNLRAPIPPSAMDFIRDFDRGEPVHPFEFEIELTKYA